MHQHVREGTFFIGGGRGVGRGILDFLAKKVVALPLPGMDLMRASSEIPKQKHLTPPPYLSKTKITGSENNKLEVLLI